MQENYRDNLSVTIISIGVGTAGGYGGAALGTLIAPGLGTTIGAIIGAVAGGGLSAWAAEALIAPFYESDAEEMFNIISEEFTELCGEYLISEEEGNRLVDKLDSVLIDDVLKEMYASEDREVFARELIEPLFEDEVTKPCLFRPWPHQIRAYNLLMAGNVRNIPGFMPKTSPERE